MLRTVLTVLCLVLLYGCSGTDRVQQTPKVPITVQPRTEPQKQELIPEKDRFGGTLVCGSISEPITMNPLLCMDSSSRHVHRLIFNALLKYDPDWNLEKDLAERYRVSDDAKEVYFKIRKGAKWHDGRSLTADDIIFTYNQAKKPGFPNANLYSHMERAEKISDTEVAFFFTETYAPVLNLFIHNIIPKHILEGQDMLTTEFNRAPVGSGPFQFVSWDAAEILHLTANPDYFMGRPYIDKYVLRVLPDSSILFFELMRGKVHYMMLTPGQFYTTWGQTNSSVSIRKISMDSYDYAFLALNQNKPMFADIKVRKALSYAINRKQIVNDVLLGLGNEAIGPISSTHWAYNENLRPYPHSLEMAKKLLAEAGWKLNEQGQLAKDDKPFEFEVLTNRGNDERRILAMIIKEEMKKLGIKVTVRTRDWTDIVRNVIPERSFDTMLIGIGPDPDPDDNSLVWHSDPQKGAYNFFGYKNEKVDKLLDQGGITMDKEMRKTLYCEMQSHLREDVPVLFLYVRKTLHGINECVKNIKPSKSNFFYNINEWYLEGCDTQE